MKLLISLKRNFISIMFMLFLLFLLIFINSNFIAVKNGINLWANNVLPSLFPFFFAVELLNYTNLVHFLGNYLNFIMYPLFNLPGCAIYPFIMGLISGYPVGAQIVCDLYQSHKLTKSQAERMLALCNNSGPLFVIATVGISFFGNSKIGVALFAIHIFSSIISGIILKYLYRNSINEYSISAFSKISSDNTNTYIHFQSLGNILRTSIQKSIKNVLIVGGFITVFSVIISIIQTSNILLPICTLISKTVGIPNNILNAFIIGLIEFTNGLNMLSKIHIKNISLIFALSSALIGFGGFSVFLQVMGIASADHLNMKKYLVGKILQGIFSGIITYLLFSVPFFSLNI